MTIDIKAIRNGDFNADDIIALCDEIERLRTHADQLQEQNVMLDAKCAELEKDAEKHRLRVALIEAEITAAMEAK